MLQELLNIGLVEIGSDDSRFEKIQAAASALAERFRKEPQLLVPATLVSLDEDIDEDDPFLIFVEELVTAEWKTLRNTHSNRPRQLLRSVAIDALAAVAEESAELSSIIWNTAASAVRHQQLRLGKAAKLIEELLNQAFAKAEAEAVKRAGMSPPQPKHKSKKSSTAPGDLTLKGQISDSDILTDIARAAGPQNDQGESLPDPNPVWPNSGNSWSHQFSPRMATAIVKAVNLATSRLAQSISKDLASHMASMEKHLLDELDIAEQLQAEREQAAAAGRMRIDVLWWAEASYSPSLKCGYGELTPAVGAMATAVDLVEIVPPLAPASVAYVLAETMAAIAKRADSTSSKNSVEDYLSAIADASPDLRDAIPEAATNDGRSRVPLLELVSEAAAGLPVASDVIRSRTGIEPDLQLTPDQFSMWMFHEIQAQRMVEELS